MPVIIARMLGCFAVRVGGIDIVPHLNPCTANLLAYLIWQGGTVSSRDRLADDLWRNLPATRALRALNTAVWRLRRTLAEIGVDPDILLVSRQDGIGLNPETDLDSDVEALEALARRVGMARVSDVDDDLLKAVIDAESAFGGEFLPGRHDDWCLLPREAFRNRFDALKVFAVRVCMRREEWRRAIDQAQRLLNRDPLQEQVHRWLIASYLRVGDRLRAKEQYAHCADLLRKELGVDPLPETQALIQSIPASAAAHVREPVESSPAIRRVLRNLDAARDTLISLDQQLRRSSR